MSLRKAWFVINGAKRMIVCDPEKDTLASVLRRIGLTGTKVGCNVGHCGACSVLLNGEPIRSCITPIRNVPEYAQIVTIEGIGTPSHLHPIQQAFITYGAVQCGFCSPGFIISSKALLDINQNPTRQEVRKWFKEHRNVCRCTGYKPIVDAVMAAAAVLRGEKNIDDITFKLPSNNTIYGSTYPRPTMLEKVTGLCDFGTDLEIKMPGDTLHLAVVQPKTCHAKILNIDYSEAETMPGVEKVITAKDVRGTNRATQAQKHKRAGYMGMVRPILCDEIVFRYGDVVAVVAARTREEARAAAKKVIVTLEELPVYENAVRAVNPDSSRIHKESPNVAVTQPVLKGSDTKDIFTVAPHVVEGAFYSTREPHLPLEPFSFQAYTDENDCVTVQCGSQNIFGNRADIASGIGLSADKIRIIMNAVGGSFGCTMTPSLPALAAVCTMATGKPVTLAMSYPEFMAFSGKRPSSYTNARLACDHSGKIIGLEFDLVFDIGAYPETAGGMAEKGARFIGYPYNVPNITGCVRSVLSNFSYSAQFRGFGAPECYTSSEALMDMMANELGMDRFEFRYRNVATNGDLTNNSYPYHEYPMKEIMDILRPEYEAAVSRAKAANASNSTRKHGIGIVWGGYHVSYHGDKCEIAVELNPDGSITHYNSWESVGQGADIGALTHAHEAFRPLGLKPEQINLVQNDTALTPVTGAANGSRSHYMVGNATLDGAKKLMDAMRKPDGSYRTYDEMTAEGIATKYIGSYDSKGTTTPLDPNTGHGDASPAANYVLMLVEVEVDIETFKTEVISVRSIADVGKIGNRQAVDGQAFGGISHSIGFALKEDYSDINKHSTLLGAGIPEITDIPDDLVYTYHETLRTTGPHGSCGCAEGFQSVGHVAVINAIKDAIGVRIYEMPATPEKLKAAYEAKQRGEEMKPVFYDFGKTLYETMADISANPV